jgi:hypothetical protein
MDTMNIEHDVRTADTAGKLVQLGGSGKRCPATWQERAASGPVADKFFAVGALFGFVGTAGYGLYLWLALNNILPLGLNYPELRYAHAVVQIYLFFGVFVLGFVSQAGGKMLGADLRFGKRPLLLLPVYVVGAFGILAHLSWGTYLVSAIFSLYAIYVAWSCFGTSTRPQQAILAVAGLSVLAISPFLSLHSPISALLILWGGFGTMIFAAGGQFIQAFLGGRNLGGRGGYLFVLLHLGSIAVLLLSPTSGLYYGCILSLAALVVYLMVTDARKWFASFYPNPLGLAFVCGYSWAIAAWVLQILTGYASADLTVHILATGWAAPLIFAVSAQVIGFLTGRDSLMPRRLWWWLLCSWQLVPFGRGTFQLFGLPSWFSIIVAIVSLSVLIAWTGSLCRAEWKMLRLQSVLKKGEILKTCG